MKIRLDNYTLYTKNDDTCKLVSNSVTYYGKFNGRTGYTLHNKGYGGEILLFPEQVYTIKWFGSGIPVIHEEHGSILEFTDKEHDFSLDNECKCTSCSMRRNSNYVVLPDGSICRRDFLQTAEELNLSGIMRSLDRLRRM